MRICQIDGAARGAVTPAALFPARVYLPARPRYFQLPCDFLIRPFRGTSYSNSGTQVLAFSKLAIHSPRPAVADQMAGGRSANRSNTKAIQAAELAVAETKPDPDAPVLNGAHAKNGAAIEAAIEADSLPAAVDGITQPKARKSSKPAKAAQSAVADIKPDPEAPVLNGAHAENGAAPETDSLPAAMNGIKQPKARKSRAGKAVKDAQSAVADIKPDPEAPVLNGAHGQNGALPEAVSLPAAMNGIKQQARKSRASKAVKAAQPAVSDIKPDPEATVPASTHAENGVAPETDSLPAAVNGSTQPKPRKSRASKAVKAAQLAVADITPDAEAALPASTHAGNGVLPEVEGLPAAVDGTKPPKARKSRAKAIASIQAPVEATVKLESGESVAAELAASIAVAKEGALLVSEETVKKARGGKKQQPQPEAMAMPAIPAAEAAPKAKGRRTQAAAAAVPLIKAEENAAEEQALTAGAEAAPAAAPRKKSVRRAKSAKASIGEAAEAAVMAVPASAEDAIAVEKAAPRKRAPRRKKAAAASDAAAEEEAAEDEDKPKPKRQRRAKSAPSELPAVEGAEGEPVKKKRRPKGPDPDAFMLPAREVLEIAQANPPGPRPVPNLGYACLNMDLREQRPPIFTNRACIQKTFLEKGLDYVSELALENCRALAGVIQWNHEKGIRLFRLSSDIFPWCTEYELKQLKDFDAIADELAFAGKLANAYDQRLTFHPSHFVKLAAETDELLNKSIKELEVHSLVFDLMGFPPCHRNKINIHVGGIYGDKEHTIRRFAENFNTRCSPNLQARMTVENDDRPNSYSMTDLLLLHNLTSIPLVFDFHHQKFCPGDFNEKGALYAAVATWPKGIRPVVHWSESQEGRIPHAHSDYISGPMNLHGLEKDIDVMIEAKCKERALLRFREAMTKPPTEDAVMASKFV